MQGPGSIPGQKGFYMPRRQVRLCTQALQRPGSGNSATGEAIAISQWSHKAKRSR